MNKVASSLLPAAGAAARPAPRARVLGPQPHAPAAAGCARGSVFAAAGPASVGATASTHPTARLASSRASLSTAALAMGLPRVAVERERAPAEDDVPTHDAASVAEYRKLLAAEEEAGRFEDDEADAGERVEVDASAKPDDTLAVRSRRGERPRSPPLTRRRLPSCRRST